MHRVVVVGAGWAGCSAALQAAKEDTEVMLLERTDMLLGTGLVGGIMRNNGRFTAAEEMIALGGGELLEVADDAARHKNIDFPGHKHASLYDISKIAGKIEKCLDKAGVKILFRHRIDDIIMEGKSIKAVIPKGNKEIEGDVFIDATGTAGPVKNCTTYGNGCVMCIYRCPSFGGRVSLTELAGIREYKAFKADGTVGSMSGACKLLKDSLSEDIAKRLSTKGVVVIHIPSWVARDMDLSNKSCQQYNLKSFQDNIILLDTGHAKMMNAYFPLEQLKLIPGFEMARYEDPYAGGLGNSIRFTAFSPRDNFLKVQGVDNLFCAGEKAGLLVGHTEAVCTGVLAGYNASRMTVGQSLLNLPTSTAVGDAIDYTGKQMESEDGRKHKYTFSGSLYFDRMKTLGLYTTNIDEIRDRVACTDLDGIFKSSKKRQKKLDFNVFTYSH